MSIFIPNLPGLRGSRSERLELPSTIEVNREAPIVQQVAIGFANLSDGIIANVGITPTPILEPSPLRRYLFLQNTSVNDIWVGGSARVNPATSIKIEAGGGTHEFNESNMYKGELWAIATIATTLIVTEGS